MPKTKHNLGVILMTIQTCKGSIPDSSVALDMSTAAIYSRLKGQGLKVTSNFGKDFYFSPREDAQYL